MASESEPFAWRIRVYYEDTDAQGVVYYANYFRFMERARTEWLRTLGVDMVKMADEERRILVVASATVDFVSPARLSDQIVVTAERGESTRATFEIKQEIYRDRFGGELLTRGAVKVAYLDSDSMKPKRIPPRLLEEQR